MAEDSVINSTEQTGTPIDKSCVSMGVSEVHAAALLEEAKKFAHSGQMPPHRFQFASSLFVKPHVFEADLADEGMQKALPGFAELFFDDTLASTLTTKLP